MLGVWLLNQFLKPVLQWKLDTGFKSVWNRNWGYVKKGYRVKLKVLENRVFDPSKWCPLIFVQPFYEQPLQGIFQPKMDEGGKVEIFRVRKGGPLFVHPFLIHT